MGSKSAVSQTTTVGVKLVHSGVPRGMTEKVVVVTLGIQANMKAGIKGFCDM